MPNLLHRRAKAGADVCTCGAAVVPFERDRGLPSGDGCLQEGMPFNRSLNGVTLRQAELVHAALCHAFSPWAHDYPPTISDQTDEAGRSEWFIYWEDGAPYDWPHLFPHGGVEEEFGFKIRNVTDIYPEGVFHEPINNCAIALSRD